MYQFTFLRHGRSRADDEKKCEGRYDTPLTEVGEAQARETAKKFRDLGFQFDRIVTSPLIRAHRTAEIINEVYGLPLATEPLLLEHDNGIIAGMDKAELNRLYPLPAFDSPFRYYPEHSGENNVMEHARAGLAVNRLIDLGPGRFLVVSHGGITNAILRNLFGMGYTVNGSGVSFRLKDNGYVVVHYDETKHHAQIVRME